MTRLALTVAECRAATRGLREGGRRVALVPTMGWLHAGHLSLVDRARAAADAVVVSIFVNPIQFGSADDLASYPRDLDRDRTLLEERGVELVFAPPVAEMVRAELLTRVTMREVTEGLEGAFRPGHFEGVLTIVAKLFHIVQPDLAVFGEKDAQQAAAIRRMVRDLDFPIEIDVGPTIRDADGLACSSRNVRLAPEARHRALALSRALRRVKALAAAGEVDVGRLEQAMRDELDREPDVEVDYAAVVDAARFAPVARLAGPCVAAIAARVDGVRLIDNVPLQGSPDG